MSTTGRKLPSMACGLSRDKVLNRELLTPNHPKPAAGSLQIWGIEQHAKSNSPILPALFVVLFHTKQLFLHQMQAVA